MSTSLLHDNNNGRAINAGHIVATVQGIRRDVPEGWTKRRVEPVQTDYGVRIDIIYEYPDGSIIRR